MAKKNQSIRKLAGKKCILLSWMYSGNYLEDNNVGHEVINLKTANTKGGKSHHYIYVCKDGKFNLKKHVSSITTLLVKTISNNTKGKNNGIKVEIIAKATGCEPLKKGRKPVAGNGEYVKEHKVCYERTLLTKIFERNVNKDGDRENDKSIALTLKAKRVRAPKKRLFLMSAKSGNGPAPRMKKNANTLCLKRPLAARAGKMYFIEGENDDFRALKSFIAGNKNSPWRVIKKENVPPPCFLMLASRYHDELTYSNLFAHFLRSIDGLVDEMFRDLLKIRIRKSCQLDDDIPIIKREDNHVDLTIRYKKQLVIIENKIRSGITNNQLERYAKKAKKDCDKYDLTLHCFLFAPKYNISIDQQELTIKKVRIGDKPVEFTRISYDDLYRFFRRHKTMAAKHLPPTEKPYYDEFLKALQIQNRDRDNLADAIMEMRFQQAVKRAHKKKSVATTAKSSFRRKAHG